MDLNKIRILFVRKKRDLDIFGRQPAVSATVCFAFGPGSTL